MGTYRHLEIAPGDIVSVANGRTWRRARVLGHEDGMLRLKFKDGTTSLVSAEHVLKEDEAKSMRKSGISTKIQRGAGSIIDRLSGGSPPSDDDEPASSPAPRMRDKLE